MTIAIVAAYIRQHVPMMKHAKLDTSGQDNRKTKGTLIVIEESLESEVKSKMLGVGEGETRGSLTSMIWNSRGNFLEYTRLQYRSQ